MNDCGVNFLIDSGSTITIISPRLYDKIPESSRPQIEYSNDRIVLADGSIINVTGKCLVEMVIGNIEVQHAVTIANIEAEGLIGSDFLSQHGCVINFKDGVLEIEGETVSYRESLGCMSSCRVKVAETVTLAAGEEVVIPGRLIRRGKHSLYGLVEPSDSFVSKHGVLVGKALVDPTNKLIPIRMMNISKEPSVIYKDTVVGTYHPVESISQLPAETPQESEPVVAMDALPDHLIDLFERSSRYLDDNQKLRLKAFLCEYKDVFATSDHDLGRTGLIKHKIDTGNNAPIKLPPRRLPLHQRAEEEKQVEQMLSRNVIEKSDSPWASPIVLVKKKDGTYRCCIDFRRVNSITVKDAYPLPRPDDCFDALYGSTWFSTLDLCSGYWQIELEPNDRPKTAFITRSGLYQFKVLPFGLCNATATFERVMELVMTGLQWKTCLIYLDDVIVYGSTFELALERLKEVFLRFRKANLKLKVKKCELFQRSVSFLGHIVSKDGISADPEKIESVKSWPVPKNTTEVRSFLGFCSYYRKFVQSFADIASPLHKLTEKNKTFEWNESCQNAFEKLKEIMTNAPVLAFPDENSSFILDTDASETGIGAVLSQIQDNQERVIAYASRKLNKSERRYCVTRRELLAVVNFVKHFRHYLYGKKFLIRTDHGSLRWLMNFKTPEGQTARWLEVLGAFNFDIEHRPGRQHGNADGMSRIPCRQCGRSRSISGVDFESGVVSDQVRSGSDSEADDRQEVGSCQESHSLSEERSNKFVLTMSGKSVVDKPSSLVGKAQEKVSAEKPEAVWLHGWSYEQLREAQIQDNCVSKVLLWKEQDISRPSWKDISSESKSVKTLWAQWDRLRVWHGILYRKWESVDGLHLRWQLVLPRQMIADVLKLMHDKPTGGHLGINRTLSSVRLRFYWPMHQADVRQYVKQCDMCASRKPTKNQKKVSLKQYQVGEPLERIAIDILGPLPVSNDGNKYIMIVVDYFTKWAESYAIPNQEACTVADKLVQEFISRFGCPRQIHTDQGRNFESKLFKRMCEMLQIEKTHTTAFHPQSDGLVERFNRTLENMLSLYVADNQKDWDQYLPLMMMAYRATPQGSTQCSPNLLMLGREVDLPIDLMFGRPEIDLDVNETDYTSKLRCKFESAYDYARGQLQKSAIRQKRNYDQRVKQDKIMKGEFVWLYTPRRKKGLSPKLQRIWSGPYLVTSVLDDCVFRIQRSPRCKPLIVHRDRLAKYHGTDVQSWTVDNQDDSEVDVIDRNDLAIENEIEDEIVISETVPKNKSIGENDSHRPVRSRKAPKRFGDWTT